MFGKKSLQYLDWKKHAKALEDMPYRTEVVNTGSTPCYKAFDYSLWPVKGYNLAYRPQPLYYDFETLKKYGFKLSENARILIGIEEFKFLVNQYEKEDSDYKYYLWLDCSQIRTYKKKTSFLIRYAPGVLKPRFILDELKSLLRKFSKLERNSDEQNNSFQTHSEYDLSCSKMWIDGWMQEFGWNNHRALSDEQREVIKINYDRLNDMIRYCRYHKWIPYIVIVPFSPNLKKLLPEAILEECLWKPIKEIVASQQLNVIDYYNDNRFSDCELYEDALTLNDKGRKLFNLDIQKKIGL